MKKYLEVAAAMVIACGVSVAAQASDSSLILKLGQLKVDDDTQTLGGGPVIIEDGRFVGAAGELEFRFDSGVALGAEIGIYGGDVAPGDAAVATYMLNAKKYFKLADWFQPYIGAGVGSVSAAYDDGVSSTYTYSGIGAQVMAGVSFEFGSVGVYTEIKRLMTRPEEVNGENFDLTGTAGLVGLRLNF